MGWGYLHEEGAACWVLLGSLVRLGDRYNRMISSGCAYDAEYCAHEEQWYGESDVG